MNSLQSTLAYYTSIGSAFQIYIHFGEVLCESLWSFNLGFAQFSACDLVEIELLNSDVAS